ncbi:MAG: hypothetical protein JWM31_2849 [Solirubrobacterales bacterium]|nr:hypothetical protein [Solirubrobacterales bacterium]
MRTPFLSTESRTVGRPVLAGQEKRVGLNATTRSRWGRAASKAPSPNARRHLALRCGRGVAGCSGRTIDHRSGRCPCSAGRAREGEGLHRPPRSPANQWNAMHSRELVTLLRGAAADRCWHAGGNDDGDIPLRHLGEATGDRLGPRASRQPGAQVLGSPPDASGSRSVLKPHGVGTIRLDASAKPDVTARASGRKARWLERRSGVCVSPALVLRAGMVAYSPACAATRGSSVADEAASETVTAAACRARTARRTRTAWPSSHVPQMAIGR